MPSEFVTAEKEGIFSSGSNSVWMEAALHGPCLAVNNALFIIEFCALAVDD